MFQLNVTDNSDRLAVTEPGRGQWKLVRTGFVNVLVGFDGESEVTVQYYSDYKIRYLILTSAGCAQAARAKVKSWTRDSWPTDEEWTEVINKEILHFTGQNPNDDHATWPYGEPA